MSKMKIEPQNERISIVEEKLEVSKKEVETGKVNISKTTHTEIESQLVTLSSEDILIERVAMNKEVDSIPKTRIEDDVTIISVVREVAVVVKKLIVVEEIHISKNKSESIEQISVPLRKEHIEIERKEDSNI